MARREPASIRRAGADRKLSVPSTKCAKLVRYSVAVGMGAAPVGGGDAPKARPFVKRPRTVETATCAAVAGEKRSLIGLFRAVVLLKFYSRTFYPGGV